MELNTNGSCIGMIGDHERTSSHTYEIESESGNGAYTVYIQSLVPRIYRCPCKRFIFIGSCKHGIAALAAERTFARTYPKQYKHEKAVQRRHLRAAHQG